MNRLKITMKKKQETMKKHLFKTRLLSFASLCGIALTFASCANEDVAQNTTGSESDNDKNLTTFVAGDEAKTRTSLDYNSSDFYWEAGDYIYVKDDNGVLQKSTNAPKSKVASFKYMVPGKFTISSSYKVYYLGKNSNGNSVTISTNQSQTAPDNTVHFGTAGDYGTAKATGTLGGKSFSFQLEHQAAYLVFLPYTSNTILHNCYLTKIEVSSDNDIAGTYTVNPTTGALDASAVTGGDKIVLATRGSSSNPNGFPLTNNTASIATNGAYMVIKPGAHTLKVRYWLKDVVTNVEGTITKTYPSSLYTSNTYYDMKISLDVKDYSGYGYYLWDARENYWSGHEWDRADPWQPVLNNQRSNNYAKDYTDPRYFNKLFPGYRISNPATHSCASLPNVNEMTWYAAVGDPRWDGDELWTTMGHLYKGGMWFKKKANISGYNPNTAVDGSDWRTTGKSQKWFVSQTPPSAADKGNYFYLPAFGWYSAGMLHLVGTHGCYWSSSASPWYNYLAFGLCFSNDYVYVTDDGRGNGYRVGTFE